MVPWDWRMLTGWEAGHALLWGVGPLLWGDGPLLWGSPFRLRQMDFRDAFIICVGREGHWSYGNHRAISLLYVASMILFIALLE